jgi:hypothetical protein
VNGGIAQRFDRIDGEDRRVGIDFCLLKPTGLQVVEVGTVRALDFEQQKPSGASQLFCDDSRGLRLCRPARQAHPFAKLRAWQCMHVTFCPRLHYQQRPFKQGL